MASGRELCARRPAVPEGFRAHVLRAMCLCVVVRAAMPNLGARPRAWSREARKYTGTGVSRQCVEAGALQQGHRARTAEALHPSPMREYWAMAQGFRIAAVFRTALRGLACPPARRLHDG